MSKFNLTEKQYRVIFNRAHREWLEQQGSELLLAKAYFKAVVSFLGEEGYSITKEADDDKTQE